MANDIASLGVRVTPSGITETTRQLAQLEEQGAKTERRAKDLAITAGKVLGGAILAGGAVAAAGLGKYINGTIEAERVQAQLAARIKSTQSAAGLAIGDLNKMAEALQRATTYDDESIGEAQALLLTFTKITSTNFGRATEAVLDMSTALGGDLKGAALQVGKALNDPVQGVTALSRAGVQFTDAQKEAIKALVETNRVADAQAIVLKELETQMGGAARAARDTLGGAIEGLKNTFDNLLEGESGSEGVQGTRQAIEDLTDTLNDPAVKNGIDSMAQGLLKITNAAVQMIAKLGDAGSALREYFADASEQSDASIQNRIDELETEVFQIERQNRNSLPIFQRDTSDQKAEIAELQRIQSARNRAEMFSGVRSSIDSTEFAKGGSSGRGADKRTKAVKELTAAQKAFNDQEEVYALLVEESAAATRELFFDRQRADEAAAEAARERLANNKALIGSMQEELTLLRSSANEQERRIALSQLSADATDEQKRAVAGMADELHKTREQISLMDSFRGTLSDTFSDYITGAKSAKEATRDFFSSLLEQAARALADKAIQQLLGSFGTASGGAAGGGWAALIGSFFGGGRAAGGPVSGNKLYEVGENGRPELFQQGGRTYLIPGNDGVVNPIAAAPGQAGARASGGGGITFNQDITVNSDGTASTSTTTNDQSAFAKAFGDRMRQVAQAEIIQQMQPGGLLYSGRAR